MKISSTVYGLDEAIRQSELLEQMSSFMIGFGVNDTKPKTTSLTGRPGKRFRSTSAIDNAKKYFVNKARGSDLLKWDDQLSLICQTHISRAIQKAVDAGRASIFYDEAEGLGDYLIDFFRRRIKTNTLSSRKSSDWYNRLKQRVVGHSRPMEFTGQLIDSLYAEMKRM